MSRIRFDITKITVIAYCTCGWRELELDRDAARRAALTHEVNVHPESRQVRAAQRIRHIRQQQQADLDARATADEGEHNAD